MYNIFGEYKKSNKKRNKYYIIWFSIKYKKNIYIELVNFIKY